MAMRTAATCLTLLAIAWTAQPARAVPPPLTIGFFDGVYSSTDPSERAVWLDRTRQSGATIVRLELSWAGVAPSPLQGGAAADPRNPSYQWQQVDSAVRDAAARGLSVLLTVSGAPAWAEGAARPAGAIPGSWRPDVDALAAFSRAAAQRYSGSFPDPLAPGATLPRVRFWQVWNEPNLSTYLAPQWVRRGGRLVPASPAYYRSMVNGFYRAVKGVRGDNVVVTAGTAPYGDPEPGGARLAPALFLREFFCLRGSRLRRTACPDPPHLDAISHHPYGIGGPRWHALNADDVAVPDIGKLVRVLRAAERSGRALPRARKRVWVTEISWDSRPPDPEGVPELTHARWLEEALYVLWRQGVDTVTWFQIRDQAPIPSYAATSQSGIYLRDGRPKLATQAFRFPFVAERASRTRVRVWGKAPAGSGRVLIQRRSGRGWVTIHHVQAAHDGIFVALLGLRGSAQLRSRDGSQVSLVWSQR
jgi:hypothetical protein